MSDGELLDAREAMSLLGINEAELQTMVARGDLRAFRSAGTMKFRRDDVVGIKSEKKTEPTIIMPQPGAGAKKPGSGILPTVSSAKATRGSSNRLPTVKPGAGRPAATIPAKAAAATPPAPPADTGTSSDQIILEEFELAPEEGAANTQQVTAQQTAVSGNVTAIDTSPDTANVTVVEPIIEDTTDANATASAIAPVATAVTTTPSGRQKVPSGRTDSVAAPALSRVRAGISSSSQSAAAKRAQASATSRSAGPLVSLMLIVTAFFSMMALTVIGVQLFKGNYDTESGQRVIPPFLEKMPLISYESTYHNLPGHPSDTEGERKRPADEFPSVKP